nr:ChuX/HutX family heme-like substrate-binding protein [Providencia rettgeri]
MNSNLYNDYQQIQKSHSNLCPHKIAALLQVSEAQLVHCRVGNEKVLRLSGKPADILQNLVSIGQAKGITRNNYAISIQTGEYSNPRFSHHGGLFLNPKALDLRMFFAQWDSTFALVEETSTGLRHSMQFFDKHGDALHQVYATDKTDMAEWQAIV